MFEKSFNENPAVKCFETPPLYFGLVQSVALWRWEGFLNVFGHWFSSPPKAYFVFFCAQIGRKAPPKVKQREYLNLRPITDLTDNCTTFTVTVALASACAYIKAASSH